MRKIVPIFCLLFFSVAACAINPVSGKRELSLVSEKEEIALGQKTDVEIRSQYGVYADLSLNEYITSVGNVLVPHTQRPQLIYSFAVLDTPVVNAFAVPGGYIYVTRGALAMMNSESELAVVLGHELGHVNARHSVRRLSKLLLVQLGLAVGGAISDTFAKISGAASLGVQLLFLKYSRDDERDADSLGVEYARRGSYNPGEMISFFSSLQRLGDLSGKHSLPGFLSTHPLTSERIQNVKLMVTENDKLLPVKNESYLQQVDHIVYGDDPRQGYVEGNVFYYPQLRFYFSFPQDWQLQNTPAQVVLASKDENAVLVLQAEKTEEGLADYAQKKATTIEGRQFLDEKNFLINGLSSFHQLYNVVQEEKETLRIRLSFIKKGSYIFSFSALATALQFGKYDSDFLNIISSFNELKDKAHLDRQPQHLLILKANGKQRLQEILEKAGMKKDLWPTAAILNGMELNDIPERNQLIKIIQ